MCGGSGLLLDFGLAQNRLGASLGTVWKSEQPALESMSLVFGLIVWKRGGPPDSISEPPSPRRRQEKWFQKAPKLKKQPGGSQVQETGVRKSRKFRV